MLEAKRQRGRKERQAARFQTSKRPRGTTGNSLSHVKEAVRDDRYFQTSKRPEKTTGNSLSDIKEAVKDDRQRGFRRQRGQKRRLATRFQTWKRSEKTTGNSFSGIIKEAVKDDRQRTFRHQRGREGRHTRYATTVLMCSCPAVRRNPKFEIPHKVIDVL